MDRPDPDQPRASVFSLLRPAVPPRTGAAPARPDAQLADALDGVHPVHELGQHRRLEPRAGPHLQHPVGGLQVEELHVQRLQRRLRRGLPEADGDGRVLVGAVPHRLGEEVVAVDRVEGAQHLQVADPPLLHALDELPPLRHVPVDHG